jgi:hypothetical protein
LILEKARFQMLKIIKKTLSIIAVPGAVMVLVPFCLLILFRIPYIQTSFLKALTKYLSETVNSEISVGQIELSYFNNLSVNDLVIKDQNLDTLLYVPRVRASIRNLDLLGGKIKLGRVRISDPLLSLITDSSGMMNLTWYLDKLTSPKDSISQGKTEIIISRVEVQNGKFALINSTAKPSNQLVDFNNLAVNNINGSIEDLIIRNDSVSLSINGIEFVEKSGFRVNKMNSTLLIEKGNIRFGDVTIISDSSIVNAGHVTLLPYSPDSYRRFLNEVKLDVNIKKSALNSSDLKYFVPFLKDINESFWLSGDIRGTVSEIKGRNIKLLYKDDTSLDMEFDMSGLPDLKNTFIFLEVNDFRSASRDIEKINIPGKRNIVLPESLRKLGVVSFSGTFTGFTRDFVAYGRINTNKGLISTDLSMRPGEGNMFRINGLIRGQDIDLGSISGNSRMLGKMTISANVDGQTEAFKTFDVKVAGNVDSVEINTYKYRNIALNGNFTDKAWDGTIKIDEANIKMDLLGMLDFNNELPEFDFTLNLQKARLFPLLIEKKDTSSAVSMLVTANFLGNSLDNLDGEIRLLNSTFKRFRDNLEIYDFSLKTYTEKGVPSITLRTDFIDAGLYGPYSFTSLGAAAKNILSTLVPSKYGISSDKPVTGKNDFSFDIKFKNTDRLNEFLKTGIKIASNSMITGTVHDDSLISVSGKAKTLAVNNNTFSDFSFNAGYSDSAFKSVITARLLDFSGLSELKDFNIAFEAFPDNFDIKLTWDNKEKVQNRGRFETMGVFRGIPGKPGSTVLTLNLLPGEVYLNDNLWKINPAVLKTDSTSYNIDRLSFTNNDNYIVIEGTVSENSSDTLYLKFNGISLNPINGLYEKRMRNSPDMLRLSLGGTLNGIVSLTNIYRNFMFESDIRLRDFSLLESRYGEIRITSAWNSERKVAELKAANDYEGVKMFDVSGYYDPGSGKVNLDALADNLPMDVMNPLLKIFASDISGRATGKVNLSGALNKPVLSGALWCSNAKIKIDYTQVRYTFNDSIRFDSEGIKFRNIQFRDERNNSAYLNGTVNHKYFKDWQVDLSVRAADCMVLNTRSKDNELFYGTAYATGVTTLKSSGSLVRFDISAKTGRNTRFFIPLITGLSVSENTFISFIEPEKELQDIETQKKQAVPQTTPTAIEIAFDLEVTPDAEVQLIMDPKTGDIMKGTGTGKLNISMDRKGILKIFGDYTIDNGSYLFTLGNILNKPFDVESGGTISFNGDVENAEINIKAIYRTKASLAEIMPELLAGAEQKERIPVECQLLLTGNLFKPMVGFDIYLPTADEETRAYLKSMIKSDEDMSRQFLFLLVMNSFYSDQSFRTQTSTAGVGSSTVGLTTMEMFSNQLSNWLSQISNDFDIGVNYRPGSTNLQNAQELQVALSTQLLNDKVVINGNFGVAGTADDQGSAATTRTSSYTGAFDIEYKINEKIRFKFFNRSNDNFYIDNGIQYTQGIGLFYRQDFNKLKDLTKKRDKGDMKKEEELSPKNRQNTSK